MASLDECVDHLKSLLQTAGYTVYDIYDMDNKKITTLDSADYPVVCIGRGIEEIDNDNSLVDYMDLEANIDLNIVFNTGEANLKADSATTLRDIKNIIYSNRNDCTWKDLVMVDNYVAQVQGSNIHSSVYGGLNINCLVRYRERQVI